MSRRTEVPPAGEPAPRRIRIDDRAVLVHGLARSPWSDLYHWCMKISWPRFFGTLGGFFLVFNAVFALIYAFGPSGDIANLNPPGYLGAFFFSVETLATVGYGDMHPTVLYSHVVATVEIFTGLMSVALITGAVFARFSQPRARIMFTRYAVVRPMDNRRTLMLRAANARQNIIVEASARLRLLRNQRTVEGMAIRRIVELPLVLDHQPMFALGWTLMHVIDETSPLAGETPESLAEKHAVLILTISGTDETTGQVLTARDVLDHDQIRWNHAFADILEMDEDGVDHVHYQRFHDVVPLPQLDTKSAPNSETTPVRSISEARRS